MEEEDDMNEDLMHEPEYTDEDTKPINVIETDPVLNALGEAKLGKEVKVNRRMLRSWVMKRPDLKRPINGWDDLGLNQDELDILKTASLRIGDDAKADIQNPDAFLEYLKVMSHDDFSKEDMENIIPEIAFLNAANNDLNSKLSENWSHLVWVIKRQEKSG